MICFDDIDTWAGPLGDVLLPLAPGDIQRRIKANNPKSFQDAIDLFFSVTAFDSVVDSMLGWVRSTSVAAYHGTRITAADVESIRTNGLLPLKAASREPRLRRALSTHPKWPEVADRLVPTIRFVGPELAGGFGGIREGQVHLTLSRASSMQRFNNNYLRHGSEFDQHVASKLLGEEGKELLTKDGEPYVIHVEVPGEAALARANAFSIEDMRAERELPHIIREFLGAWCFRLSRPGYQSRDYQPDCGMMFESAVPAQWIRRIEAIPDFG